METTKHFKFTDNKIEKEDWAGNLVELYQIEYTTDFAAAQYVKKGEKGGFVHKTAEIKDGVYISPTSGVFQNCIIEENAKIRGGSIIWENTKIGKRTTIDKSSVHPSCNISNNVWIHRRCEIGEGCTFLDHVEIAEDVDIWKNTRIGSRSSVYEHACVENGVSIGDNVRIHDRCRLKKNVSIEDNTIVPNSHYVNSDTSIFTINIKIEDDIIKATSINDKIFYYFNSFTGQQEQEFLAYNKSSDKAKEIIKKINKIINLKKEGDKLFQRIQEENTYDVQLYGCLKKDDPNTYVIGISNECERYGSHADYYYFEFGIQEGELKVTDKGRDGGNYGAAIDKLENLFIVEESKIFIDNFNKQIEDLISSTDDDITHKNKKEYAIIFEDIKKYYGLAFDDDGYQYGNENIGIEEIEDADCWDIVITKNDKELCISVPLNCPANDKITVYDKETRETIFSVTDSGGIYDRLEELDEFFEQQEIKEEKSQTQDSKENKLSKEALANIEKRLANSSERTKAKPKSKGIKF